MNVCFCRTFVPLHLCAIWFFFICEVSTEKNTMLEYYEHSTFSCFDLDKKQSQLLIGIVYDQTEILILTTTKSAIQFNYIPEFVWRDKQKIKKNIFQKTH